MKLHCWLFGIAVMAVLAMTPPHIYAEDTPIPTASSPSENTPAILEVTPTLPTEGLIEPDGQYKELADTAVASLHKYMPNVKVRTMVRPGVVKHKTRTRLLVSYAGAPQVTFTFLSNCAVNSQFSIETPATVTAQAAPAADPDLEAETLPVLPDAFVKSTVTDVCKHWTRLNHNWVDKAATVPKTCHVRLIGNKIDVSYNSDEVKQYEQTVATIRRTEQTSVATR